MKQLLYIDLFCGAGGTSTGVERATLNGNKCAEVIACVNHDKNAIASHAANHPHALHFTEDIRTLDLTQLVEHTNNKRAANPDALVVLWASLECTNFSKAKGGMPRDADCVKRLMNGEKADMVFTDPPYGIDYSGGRTQVVGKKDYGKLKNDDLQGAALGNLICNIFNFNQDVADVYICVSPIMQKPFLDFIEDAGKKINAVIVWDKISPGLGYMAYRRQCEFILFIKGGKFHQGDNSDVDLWRIGRDDTHTYVHGTQKPIPVPGRAITNSSKEGSIVLDYFGGSGSTLIACEQLNRKCFIMELDHTIAM